MSEQKDIPMIRSVGRPLMFATVADFEQQAAKYFKDTPQEQWTITGLAVALDTSRVTLMEYENRDEFTNAIKKAKDKVEMAYEVSLRKRGGSGDIFGLKNFGWRDKTETDVTTNGESLNLQADPAKSLEYAKYIEQQTKSA